MRFFEKGETGRFFSSRLLSESEREKRESQREREERENFRERETRVSGPVDGLPIAGLLPT